ncbi:TPM domain-containing protein [Massilia sp. CF038]|uniref:TPM domain-containing protein n=1 Tax=Massilia sp. CF038 TaxID=1881045 RepID=UPI001E55B785|nr:TPM domain-containing protein [Massilia sp. CF038]
MDRCKRQWRHWRASSSQARSLFPDATLSALGQAIASGEQRHRGEVRLIVEHALPSEAIWADVSMRQRALALFAEYGVWDTEERCGVLLYVNLAERKVEIVADRQIAGKIDAPVWQQVCRRMTDGFARGDFLTGTQAAIDQVNGLLATHFPANGSRPNELPDRPVVL